MGMDLMHLKTSFTHMNCSREDLAFSKDGKSIGQVSHIVLWSLILGFKWFVALYTY